MERKNIELLAPAGDMERLHMAVAYGADAVYLAGSAFGMRSFAGNFTPEELKAAVALCHGHGVRVHVTCNTMPRNDEAARLPQWLEYLNEVGVDAVILADVGVLSLAKRYAPRVQCHISTQASIVNYQSARAWHELGARTSRIGDFKLVPVSVEEKIATLLDSVDGKNQERDYCILTLFLNCGLRISELVGLNLSDIQEDALRVLGKGNKVRIIYLNDACQDAIAKYLAVRRPITGRDANALFLSSQNERISRSTVHAMVKKRLGQAGIDPAEYSSHKLRHTAATLMLQNGVDVRAVQEVLGHDHLNTTEIYTHIDNESLRIAAKANPLSHVKKSRKKQKETG